MAGPTAQLLEQLPSMPTSPLLKGDRFNWTDSWSEFSEDLSTMVIVHCCVMGRETEIFITIIKLKKKKKHCFNHCCILINHSNNNTPP